MTPEGLLELEHEAGSYVLDHSGGAGLFQFFHIRYILVIQLVHEKDDTATRSRWLFRMQDVLFSY
jgi:hypothetical protein